MICSKFSKCKYVDELLKMSLVPVACQECRLNDDGLIHSETIEWLLDLQNRMPIWSRLLDINTSGFVRKLPLSMTQHYDIEVAGRLWSLWGSRKKLSNHHHSKSYMATTCMALCAARVMSLNSWDSGLMDIIKDNGRRYFKESIKMSKCCRKDFQLQNLLTECNLEGIRFSLGLKTVQKGFLYSTPLDCQINLALALIKFVDCFQFGILECCNRILGFGFIDGPQGGYFLYDAQSFSAPIFARNISAPYLLRTNHLQVLLYCLVVALNVSHLHAAFCLHHVQIVVENPYKNQAPHKTLSNNSIAGYPQIIPSELWKTAENQSLKSEPLTNASSEKELTKSQGETSENEIQRESSFKKKYRRNTHNIKKEDVEQSVIKPFVDADRKSDEDIQLRKDFVRLVCSDTVLPVTDADLPAKSTKEFSCNLLDALFMGPETCLMFKDL